MALEITSIYPLILHKTQKIEPQPKDNNSLATAKAAEVFNT